MLNQAEVDHQEEQIRERIRQLNDQQRAAFYAKVRPQLRDPDTYAALNWFFITGVHHFYLGRWLWGSVDLLLFVFAVALILFGYIIAGIALIAVISVLEFWALFRAQIIVQDWNNRLYIQELNQLPPTSASQPDDF